MFNVGDTLVHPDYGAGVVTEIRKLGSLGNEEKRYYSIELLAQPETTVMVPVTDAEQVGLRPPISQSKVSRIWHILRSAPNKLPSDHNKRYEMLKGKLHSGDTLKVAEVLRDLAWRQEQKRRLTIRGKRLYDRGMELLAGEIAGTQHRDVETTEFRISEILSEGVTANAPA